MDNFFGCNWIQFLRYRIDVLFDDFTSVYILGFFVVYGAIRWDELKALLGTGAVTDYLICFHSLSVHGFWLY